MTYPKAFEAWFQSLPFVDRSANDIWFGRTAWLAACAWQREQDAKIAECHGSYWVEDRDGWKDARGKAVRKIATAIRHQQGGP